MPPKNISTVLRSVYSAHRDYDLVQDCQARDIDTEGVWNAEAADAAELMIQMMIRHTQEHFIDNLQTTSADILGYTFALYTGDELKEVCTDLGLPNDGNRERLVQNVVDYVELSPPDTSKNTIKELQAILTDRGVKFKAADTKNALRMLLDPALDLSKHGKANGVWGYSFERALADVFEVPHPLADDRVDDDCVCKLKGLLTAMKDSLPVITEAIAHDNGPVDFMCVGGETISAKTLKDRTGKVAGTYGQPTLKRFDEIFETGLEGKLEGNPQRFSWLKDNIQFYLNKQLEKLFDCTYLYIATNCAGEPAVQLAVSKKDYFTAQHLIIFNRPDYVTWNPQKNRDVEFSTNIVFEHAGTSRRIGELQFHTGSRKEVKFRFYSDFLLL